VIVSDRVETAVPGAGRYRLVATRDAEGTYAMVYVPAGRAFTVRMDAVRGDRLKAWWFNPRTGKATVIGTFASQGDRTFTPPDRGEMTDWVLVMDDVAKGYGVPGGRALGR
jgi:hypothetical protein